MHTMVGTAFTIHITLSFLKNLANEARSGGRGSSFGVAERCTTGASLRPIGLKLGTPRVRPTLDETVLPCWAGVGAPRSAGVAFGHLKKEQNLVVSRARSNCVQGESPPRVESAGSGKPNVVSMSRFPENVTVKYGSGRVGGKSFLGASTVRLLRNKRNNQSREPAGNEGTYKAAHLMPAAARRRREVNDARNLRFVLAEYGHCSNRDIGARERDHLGGVRRGHVRRWRGCIAVASLMSCHVQSRRLDLLYL